MLAPPMAPPAGMMQPAGPGAMPGQQAAALGTMPMQGPMGQGAMPPLPAPPVTLHDVVVVRSKTYAQVKIEPVPPEEFGISRNARSLATTDYAFHKVIISRAKLVSQGYDEAQVKTLTSYIGTSNTEELNRDTVDESRMGSGDDLNWAGQQVEVTEHYIRMDYKGDGKPCLYQVTTGGSQGDILKKDGKPDIEEIDAIPLAAMTPVIITHRFFGRSIADLVMDIQRIKTALLRSMLDNAYLSNNPRVEVAESFAGPDTLDDLLVSRPGGIVRTKQPGGLNWQIVPSIAAQTFPVLEYMDSTREFRTGVTRQGQGIDADALQNQSAAAVNNVFTAAQSRIKLIARIFAETGIRDLFALIHATIRKHGQEAQTVQLRGQWVAVDPREWKKRDHMTAHVGLGDGTKQQQLGMMNMVIGAQEKAIAAGLVSRRNLHNSATNLARLAGFKNADQFFVDPGKPPDQSDPASQPIPPPPDPKVAAAQQQAQLEQQKAQHQAQLDDNKQKNDLMHQQAKNAAELELARQKAALDKDKMLLDAELKTREHQQQMAHEQQHHEQQLQIAAHKANAATKPKASIEVKHGAEEITGPMSGVVAQLGHHLATHSQAQTQAIVGALQHAAKPKRVVRGKDGKVSHVETVG